jgi:hypothetical protein
MIRQALLRRPLLWTVSWSDCSCLRMCTAGRTACEGQDAQEVSEAGTRTGWGLQLVLSTMRRIDQAVQPADCEHTCHMFLHGSEQQPLSTCMCSS